LELARGGMATITHQELQGAPPRPGLVVRVEREAYGFELMVTCASEDSTDEQPRYRGHVLDVWGMVP
jgi:hypothetical protein